ncbi:DUF11 domain-containing protein [Candidatus Saccharibacteria bacterium]|nr:DUF11 domain-containing protein [Candidatus Saccharibacteria bacterium]
MKNIIKKITQKIPKTIAIFAAIAATGFISSGAYAWGPDRPTFTMEKPATYPTFNSIVDNPTIGDERDFVRVGQINADVTELSNEVEVVPGHQYLVYIYFHNNASATYNDAAHNHSGVAVATTMASSFSTVLTPGERATITGTITAKNSNPGSVWDEAYMTTKTPKVLLHYVTGSAKIYNDWKANGSIVPSSLFTKDGTLVGLNELNGVIPGCEEYHGVVTYVLQADELKGTIDKEVSTDGTNYSTSVDAKPGDEIHYRITVKNAGDVALTNATVVDSMPPGVTLVPGSVQFSANNSGTWENLSDNIIETGYNFGTIGTGNTIQIIYRAKLTEEVDCETNNSYVNVASLTYDSDGKFGDNDNSSTAVNVKTDECEEPSPEDCESNPSGCVEPVIPENCTTNPNLPGCDLPEELPKTGPLEIAMAVIVVLGICAGGFYFYRTRRTLKTVSDVISGGPDGGSASDSSIGGPDNSPISPDNSPVTPDNDPTTPDNDPTTPTPDNTSVTPGADSVSSTEPKESSPIDPVAATVNPTPTSSSTDNAEPKQPFEPQPPIPPQA